MRPRSTASPGFERRINVTRAFALRSPPGTERIVVDTPAALASGAHVGDGAGRKRHHRAGPAVRHRHPCGVRCIADLLLVAKVHRSEHGW